MWKIFQRSASTDLAREAGATVYCLEFSDKPMYLVQQSAESSTDSAPKSTSTNQENGKHSSESKQG